MALEDLTDEELALLVRQLQMAQASGNAPSTQGGYAPSITDFAFDAPSMLGGIPLSVNSKGETNPYGVESEQKRFNYAQDLIGSGGLGNNMLSWMTGGQATDPSAWQPVRTGVGQPIQFTGQSTIDAYANSGSDDWQSFMADRIAKGDTPAAAFTALKKLVQGTDDTGGVSAASPGLLASLPASFDTNQIPGQESAVDPKTDRGFATMYDTKALMSFADDLFKGIAKDKALQGASYQDPKTGQWFSGYEDKKTEQMEAADKLGLAYPTQSYGDQDYIRAYQQRMLGSDDTYDVMDREQRVADSQSALQAAQTRADDAQDYMSSARAAYERTMPKPQPTTMSAPVSGVGGMAIPRVAATPDVNVPGTPVTDPTAGLRVVSLNSAGEPVMWATPGGQLINAEGMSALGNRVTPKGTKVSDIPTKTEITPTPAFAGFKGTVTPGKKTEPTGAQALGAAYALGSTRAPGRAELDAATKRKTKANAAASDAQQAYYRSQFMTDDEMSRAQVAATMRYLAHQGRTPLQDQLASRSQTIRNLIGY